MTSCPDCGRRFPESENRCPECGAGSAEPADETDDLIGRSFFGEYTITDRLGEGGMGAVYLAEQDKIGQRIALKVLHTDTADSEEVVQRFHREAKVISILSHPNIVRVFIFGRTDDDLLFLAMEHVDGTELRDRLEPGRPLDESTAIKIMKQTCSAVAAAHDLGILHRDLKPENLLLTEFRGEEDFVKILDFGLAKIEQPESQDPELTQAGIVFGTPEYLSPEQARADDLDHRTDIYALGCILFEMMTGHIPFDSDRAVEILKKKAYEDPPRASEFGPVPKTIDDIIARAMATERDDRFSTAMEMFEALEDREDELASATDRGRRDTWFPGQELAGTRSTPVSEAAGSAEDTGNDPSSPPDGDDAEEDIGDDDQAAQSSNINDTLAMEQPPSPLTDEVSGDPERPPEEGRVDHELGAGGARETAGPEENRATPRTPGPPADDGSPDATSDSPSSPEQSASSPDGDRSRAADSRPSTDERSPPPEETDASADSAETSEIVTVGYIVAASVVIGVLVALVFFYFLG